MTQTQLYMELYLAIAILFCYDTIDIGYTDMSASHNPDKESTDGNDNDILEMTGVLGNIFLDKIMTYFDATVTEDISAD